MTRNPAQHHADLRGAARLATEATAGLTDLVEAMHERIARVPGLATASPSERTAGITGLVYKTVRGVTRLVGGSVDALLGLLTPALMAPQRDPADPDADATWPNTDPPAPQREALVAALNGVLGDHLAASANPLATSMALRHQGRALVLQAAALKARLPQAGGRVLVAVHGLCMNDLQWRREGHDHAQALARDAGFTSIYLHYNSGQHISTNGQALAQQLEQLAEAWPGGLDSLTLLCHSMGGLLARSALHHATLAGHSWPARLQQLVFLGTPHHGAPLERAGNWVDILLGAAPYAAPLARLARVRSAGITDLRHACLVDADWAGRDRFARGGAGPLHLPLPTSLACYAVAASMGEAGGDLKDTVLGDGLVPLRSALGQHKRADRCLMFAPQHTQVVFKTHHMALLSSAEVYQALRRWLA